jgi:hypothetical protein
MLGVWLAGVILAAGTDPAAAPAAPTPTPAAAKASVKDPNALVCHSEQLPGSRLSTRVCMTAVEAARRQQQDRRDLGSAQMQSARPAGDMMMMAGPR